MPLTDKPEKNMKFNLSLDVAVIITIFTVFLFANGNAYLGGYLQTFNIIPSTLGYSIQDKIYIGYLKGFSYLIGFLCFIFLYIVCRYVLLSLDIPRRFDNYLDKKLRKSRAKYNPSIHNSSFYEDLDNSYKQNTSLGLIVFILLISTLFLLAHTEKSANAQALKNLESFAFKKIEMTSNTKKSEFFLIQCGSNLCAVIDRDKRITLQDPKKIAFYLNKKSS